MNKTVGSILFWVVVLGALAYGAYAFYFSTPNPEEKTPLPQKVQTERLKHDEPPLKGFEKDMEKRVENAKSGGVDLGKPKSDKP